MLKQIKGKFCRSKEEEIKKGCCWFLLSRLYNAGTRFCLAGMLQQSMCDNFKFLTRSQNNRLLKSAWPWAFHYNTNWNSESCILCNNVSLVQQSLFQRSLDSWPPKDLKQGIVNTTRIEYMGRRDVSVQGKEQPRDLHTLIRYIHVTYWVITVPVVGPY